MKKIESFSVAESFGWETASENELMEVNGGMGICDFCIDTTILGITINIPLCSCNNMVNCSCNSKEPSCYLQTLSCNKSWFE